MGEGYLTFYNERHHSFENSDVVFTADNVDVKLLGCKFLLFPFTACFLLLNLHPKSIDASISNIVYAMPCITKERR